jgi:hypothetical protein
MEFTIYNKMNTRAKNLSPGYYLLSNNDTRITISGELFELLGCPEAVQMALGKDGAYYLFASNADGAWKTRRVTSHGGTAFFNSTFFAKNVLPAGKKCTVFLDPVDYEGRKLYRVHIPQETVKSSYQITQKA